MRKYTLFFSWQSDKRDAKDIISKKLHEIKSEFEKEDVCLILDQDTRNRVGTENIDQCILGKIDACDIFVADVTPIATLDPRKEGGHVKLIPNANVMYEYGYAKGIGKMNRCVLLANLLEGENKEDLPFDINHDTITEFKSASNLGGLKSWILNIIEKVEKERTTPQCTLAASIHFSEEVDEITIYPQYVKRQYVWKSHRLEHETTNKDLAAQIAVGGVFYSKNRLQTYMNNVAPAIANLQIAKPVSKTTYLDRFPVSFVISNDSDIPLENCKVYISCQIQNVHFFDSNEENTYAVCIRHVNDVFVENDEVFRHHPLINPHENLSVGEVYISVPHDLSEVILDWHISSAQGNSYGQLLVKVSPLFENETIENNNLAGETKVVGKTITE